VAEAVDAPAVEAADLPAAGPGREG
jgi:hypothetical protein